jgi:hypothetical protein
MTRADVRDIHGFGDAGKKVSCCNCSDSKKLKISSFLTCGLTRTELAGLLSPAIRPLTSLSCPLPFWIW